jgi:hypothetical protein
LSLAVLRAELEARMPRYRDAAPAISKLGIGLDDAEFVGGVLWFGLIYRGGEGNPAEQERAIMDRLVQCARRRRRIRHIELDD